MSQSQAPDFLSHILIIGLSITLFYLRRLLAPKLHVSWWKYERCSARCNLKCNWSSLAGPHSTSSVKRFQSSVHNRFPWTLYGSDFDQIGLIWKPMKFSFFLFLVLGHYFMDLQAVLRGRRPWQIFQLIISRKNCFCLPTFANHSAMSSFLETEEPETPSPTEFLCL